MSKVTYKTVVGINDNIILDNENNVKVHTKYCTKCGRKFKTSEGWRKTCPMCDEVKEQKKVAQSRAEEKAKIIARAEKQLQARIKAPKVVYKPTPKGYPSNYHPNNKDTVEYQEGKILELNSKVSLYRDSISELRQQIAKKQRELEEIEEQVAFHQDRLSIIKKNPKIFS